MKVSLNYAYNAISFIDFFIYMTIKLQFGVKFNHVLMMQKSVAWRFWLNYEIIGLLSVWCRHRECNFETLHADWYKLWSNRIELSNFLKKESICWIESIQVANRNESDCLVKHVPVILLIHCPLCVMIHAQYRVDWFLVVLIMHLFGSDII